MKKYYIAYGSNMDLNQIKYRCPDAELIGKSEVKDYELLFKGSKTGNYATIEKKKNSRVPVLIWKISMFDERNLDFYEGFPHFYYKKEIDVLVDGETIKAMAYIMDEKRKLGKPTEYYYGILEKAYKLFGFDMKILEDALSNSIF